MAGRSVTGEGTGLVIEGLSISFGGHREAISALSLAVGAGESVGLVGESGSGKSLTARAVLGILPPGVAVEGRIMFDGAPVLDMSPPELQKLRGSGIAMIFQDPMSSLNPVLSVGDAIVQVILSHSAVSRGEAWSRAVELMQRVGIRNAASRASSYPHEFSGGMRQRIMIAMVLAARPRLLLADEPTTALDVIVQAGILELLADLRRSEGMGLLFISHDLAVVAAVCDRIAVMYAGEIVEEGPTAEVLSQPYMPYTLGLLASTRRTKGLRRLSSIAGSPPPPGERPSSCRFAARCPLVVERCLAGPIPLANVATGRKARCVRAAEVPGLDPSIFASTEKVAHV